MPKSANLNRKKNLSITKTCLKNRLTFSRKLHFEIDFRLALKEILKSHRTEVEANNIIFNTIAGKNFRAINYNETQSESLLMVKKLNRDKQGELLKGVYKFINDFDLGREWEISLITLVVKGEFLPPRDNFYIDSSGNKKGKLRTVLVLNPDTSLEDLEAYWADIKNKQKELWPTFKKINMTKKSFPNFYEVFYSSLAAVAEAEKQNQDKIKTQYEERLYDPVNPKKSESAINEFRQLKNQTGEGKRSKPLKFKEKVSLKRVIRSNKSKSQESKVYNRILQNKKRQNP